MNNTEYLQIPVLITDLKIDWFRIGRFVIFTFSTLLLIILHGLNPFVVKVDLKVDRPTGFFLFSGSGGQSINPETAHRVL